MKITVNLFGKGSPRDRPMERTEFEYTKEIGELIRGCMDGLPVNQREAFVLREVEGLGTSEICKILAVSVTNFEVLMHRARARLRKCLEAKGLSKPEVERRSKT